MWDTRGGGLVVPFAQRFADGSPALNANEQRTPSDAAKCLRRFGGSRSTSGGAAVAPQASASATHATIDNGQWRFGVHGN